MRGPVTALTTEPPRALLDVLGTSPKEILLLGHVHPDGDVLGTLLGLGLVLEGVGWRVTFAGPHPVPETLGFLPGADRWQVWTSAPRTWEVVVLTDCPDERRCEGLLERARGPASHVLNIDHHPDNRRYGTVNWIDASAAATGEMVHDLVQALGHTLTPAVALSLFAAVHTDTGSFCHSNTTTRTFRTAAALTAAGADPALVADWLYQRRPATALRELGEVLSRVEVSEDQRVAWVTIPRGLISEHLAANEDLVSYPRSIGSVRVAALLRETGPGVVKASLRGKGDVPVNAIAGHFGGGGHRNAAGCTLHGTLAEATDRLLSAVREALRPPTR